MEAGRLVRRLSAAPATRSPAVPGMPSSHLMPNRDIKQDSISLTGTLMNRRQFISSSGAAGIASASASAQTKKGADTAPKRALMKLGCQSAPTNEAHVKYFARY